MWNEFKPFQDTVNSLIHTPGAMTTDIPVGHFHLPVAFYGMKIGQLLAEKWAKTWKLSWIESWKSRGCLYWGRCVYWRIYSNCVTFLFPAQLKSCIYGSSRYLKQYFKNVVNFAMHSTHMDSRLHSTHMDSRLGYSKYEYSSWVFISILISYSTIGKELTHLLFDLIIGKHNW